MAQWASTYAEAALGLSKTFGDLIGPCMFAITMGISRLIFGKYGEKMDLMKFMTGFGILCVICYLLTTLSSNPVIGLTGCIVCLEQSVLHLKKCRPVEPQCLHCSPWPAIWEAALDLVL